MAGMVFDYHSPTDFKFVQVVAGTNQAILGHRNASGWSTDAVVVKTISPGATNTLMVALQGKNATVSLNGVAVLGFTYNELLTDGGLGFFSRNGASSFGSMQIRGDDPTYADGGFNLVAPTTPETSAPVAPLTSAELMSIVEAGVRRWEQSEALDTETSGRLKEIQFQVADLPGLGLGREVAETTVQIDFTAAGFGWFVDPTPMIDEEYRHEPFTASGPNPAAGRMDLLTVVMHELGHALGLEHEDPHEHPDALMAETLEAGARRIPTFASARTPSTSPPATHHLAPIAPGVPPSAPKEPFAAAAPLPGAFRPAAVPHSAFGRIGRANPKVTAPYDAAPGSAAGAVDLALSRYDGLVSLLGENASSRSDCLVGRVLRARRKRTS
jgi:hypothetical protein